MLQVGRRNLSPGFHIGDLPIANPVVELQPTDLVQNSTSPKQTNLTILVVDDRPDFSKSYIYLLESIYTSATFLQASSAREALELLRTTKPTIVISDYHMGALSGIDLRREMLEDPEMAKIPFVLHSSAITNDDVRNITDMGLNILAVLEKGVRTSNDRVKELIDKLTCDSLES